MHRERKQAYIETLQYEVELRDQKIVELQNQLSASKAECEHLKTVITSMSCGGFQPVQMPPLEQVPFPHSVSLPTHGFQIHPTQADDVVVRRLRSGTAVTSSEGSDTESSIDASWADLHRREDCSPIETASPSPSPEEGSNAQARPTLSMFSIVLLLGISFFSGSFMTSGPAYPLSLAAPHARSPSDSPYLLGPESRMVVDSASRVHAGGRVLLALPSDEEHASSLLHSEVPVQRIDNSKALGKWTPLQLIAPVHHWSSHSSSADQTFDATDTQERERAIPDENTSPQIWKYQHHITTIFPAEQDTIDIKNDSETETTHKRYLRTSTSPSPQGSDRVSRDIAMYYDQSSPLFAAARSKVLITEGRVLLDPALAARAAVLQPASTTPSTERGIIPSSWRHLSPSSTTSSSSTPSATAGESTLPANQLLTMLVPASAVQWGGSSWVDGDSPDNSDVVMEHLLRNTNLTDVIRRQDDGSDSIDLSSLWVEIGCTVLKARIVQDVSVIDGRDQGI
jgi:hypothetical protein